MPNPKVISKLPPIASLGMKQGPSPARIFITLKYIPELNWLGKISGFRFTPTLSNNTETTRIDFEIPVMPATFKLDFGNSKDTKNVVQVGEVVLPKYGKSWQFRWDSFFPYDPDANYVNPTLRGMSWQSLQSYGRQMGRTYQDLKNLTSTKPTPAVYINLFNLLSDSKIPFEIAISFYDGGHIDSIPVTVDTFSAEPENNGDYKYSISLVEWKDVSPKTVDSQGNITNLIDNQGIDGTLRRNITGLEQFFLMCKECYSVVSKYLIFAVATYNGLANLVFDGSLMYWKFKSSFKSLATNFRIFDNIFGLPKITSKDTSYVNQSLKALSFTKASKQMADFLLNNKKYSSGKI